MAKQVLTTTEYTDDLDGSKAQGTIAFGYDGIDYEIDLSKAHSKAFATEIAPYVAAARKVKTTRSRGPVARAKPSAKHDLSIVRAWATDNGHTVSSRGRISATVIAAYEAATK